MQVLNTLRGEKNLKICVRCRVQFQILRIARVIYQMPFRSLHRFANLFSLSSLGQVNASMTNTQSTGMIRRAKVRSVNVGGVNNFQKRPGASGQTQSGVYGIGQNANQQANNRIKIAWGIQDNVPLLKQQQNGQNKHNIKEVMNTSAPICISSYIKGAGGTRPNTKGGNRRQASFNHAAGGATANNVVRRGNSSSGTGNIADLGIVAGQTMNLSRANGS